MDIGQPVISPLEAVGKACVIEAEEMHRGGVEVVDMHGILDDVVAEIISFTVDMASADSASGHENAEAPRVMVSTVVVAGQGSLGVDSPAELAPPNHQGVLEQPPLFQFRQQSSGGLVGVVALAFDAGGQVVVLIPASVVELDEPDAAFCQSAGEDAVRCERTRLFGFWPVAFIDGFGF